MSVTSALLQNKQESYTDFDGQIDRSRLQIRQKFLRPACGRRIPGQTLSRLGGAQRLSPPPSPSTRGSAYARCACARAPHAPALRPRPSSPRPAPRSDSCFFESKKASCNGNVTARSARGLACGKRANRGSAPPLTRRRRSDFFAAVS